MVRYNIKYLCLKKCCSNHCTPLKVRFRSNLNSKTWIEKNNFTRNKHLGSTLRNIFNLFWALQFNFLQWFKKKNGHSKSRRQKFHCAKNIYRILFRKSYTKSKNYSFLGPVLSQEKFGSRNRICFEKSCYCTRNTCFRNEYLN